MKTALIAGEGRLPLLLSERVAFHRVVALEGFEPEGLEIDGRFRGETIGSFIADLRAEGVTRICLAGGIARPALDPSKLDAATLPLVPRLAQAVTEGDDAALRMVLTFFEEAGIAPVGAHELCPDLLPPEGVLAGELTDAAQRDAGRGDAILAAMGSADIGQACVVARGQALVTEGMAGTDWMLATLAAARGQGTLAARLPEGGILCKAPKPGQDRRVDLPAIGPETIRNAVAAGLDGIAVEAGGVMLLDADEVTRLAREAGLLLWVRGAMKVFLVAGEPSGDRLGAALMDGLRALRGDVTFEGVGGPLMESRGLASLFAMEELSVMGIAEVLPKYPALHRRMVQTAEAVMAARPDVLITIDSPDFCLRVARRVRRHMRVRTVHYVAPSVWAWRPGRARAMAPHVDQVLALLPFEPPYMEAAGMRCDFVGHPVVSEPLADPDRVRTLRAEAAGGPLVVVLPGSRRSEVTRLMPVFGAAMRQLRRRHEGVRILLPTVPHLNGLVADLSRDWPETRIVDSSDAGEKRAMFAAADVALAASGTVSLELARSRTPMVVAYDMSWLSWQIMHRMALIDTVTLVNLVVERKVVPEFLGPDCQPARIAAALAEILLMPGLQKDALDRTMAALGEDGAAPGLRAAEAVLDGLARETA